MSEVVFKHDLYGTSPIFVLFVYSAITQIAAGLVLVFRRTTLTQVIKNVASWQHIVWLNIYTLAAFGLYFFAINSPLGAGLNAFVDYGSAPMFTAIVGAFLVGHRLDARFAICAIISGFGILLMTLPRIAFEGISLAWISGLLFAILSSLSSALYRVYFKIVLTRGMPLAAVILSRLCATTVVLGGILILDRQLIRSDLLLPISVMGLIGFCLPLFLMLVVIRSVAIPRLAMLLFAFPALTLFFSIALRLARFYWSDLVAAAVILLGPAMYERASLLRQSK